MHDLTGFQRDLLLVTNQLDKPSGQTIRREIEEDIQDRVNHGRLYPNLDSLMEQGLLEKGEKDRRTNYYAVTEQGRREIESYKEFVEASL